MKGVARSLRRAAHICRQLAINREPLDSTTAGEN